MSLINKMLQDLDARASTASADVPQALGPDRASARRWRVPALVGAGAALVGVALVLTVGRRDAAPEPTPVAAQPAAPAPAAAPPARVQIPQEALEKLAQLAAEQRAREAGTDKASAPAPEPAAPEAAPPAPAPRAQAPRATASPSPERAAPARRAVVAAVPAPRKQPPAPAAAQPAAKAGAAAQGRQQGAAQLAESSYRRALSSLEEGRVPEAIGHLQAALRANPRHDTARQTLVALLIEAKRPDEALRQLGAALALDPAQPAMAMLMARLQIERGSPGVDTLLRTLPYAAGNGEYHAFLAGALQREGRHREAAEHYGVALRTAPQNGVWWMGLGMSLQGERRNLEAAAAFQKALDSGSLSPELQGFVERKLKQSIR